jgi:hypothetical protein
MSLAFRPGIMRFIRGRYHSRTTFPFGKGAASVASRDNLACSERREKFDGSQLQLFLMSP